MRFILYEERLGMSRWLGKQNHGIVEELGAHDRNLGEEMEQTEEMQYLLHAGRAG